MVNVRNVTEQLKNHSNAHLVAGMISISTKETNLLKVMQYLSKNRRLVTRVVKNGNGNIVLSYV